jgi:hypothetical protein
VFIMISIKQFLDTEWSNVDQKVWKSGYQRMARRLELPVYCCAAETCGVRWVSLSVMQDWGDCAYSLMSSCSINHLQNLAKAGSSWGSGSSGEAPSLNLNSATTTTTKKLASLTKLLCSHSKSKIDHSRSH